MTVTRYVRFEHAGTVAYGIWDGDVVRELEGDVFNGATLQGRELPAAEVHFLVPCEPTKVLFEGELALVIGKTAKDVSVEAASEHVFGVTIGNDLVDREWLLEDLQWFRAKGADGFGPIGPAVVTGLDYGRLGLETRVNGEVRQSSNTSELVFSPDKILSYCSRYVTLEPGDVIFTGTPGQTQAVAKGDTVEVEIEGVGLLRNTVV